MRVRVWWIGLVALGLVALVVGLRMSGPRPGGKPDPSSGTDGGTRSAENRREGPHRSAGPRPSGGAVDWPPPGTGSTVSPDTPSVAVDAAALATELEQQVEAIRSSGPGSGGLLHDAEAVSRPWEALARASGMEIDLRPWECHRLGCFGTAIHRSRQSVDVVSSRILASAELASWPGTKTQSAPIPRPDGTFEVTWLLYVSPEDASASPMTGGL